jgi:predicted thioesterase
MPLEPGQAATVERVVTRELTADSLGNPGVTVFATVGTGVDVRHLAATPPGMRVRATAVLRETDGRRCLFEVEAWDEVEKIAEGRHERFLVDLTHFLERAAAKTARAKGSSRAS